MNLSTLMQEIKDGLWEETDYLSGLNTPRNNIRIDINGLVTYFKRKDKTPEVKFPIVFEDNEFRINIFPDSIIILDKIDGDNILMNNLITFPLLIQAVDKWKELQEGKK